MIVEIEMGIQQISDQIGEWGEKLKLGNFWIAKKLGEILVADFTENGGENGEKEVQWELNSTEIEWNCGEFEMGKWNFEVWGGKGFSRVFDLRERIGGKERWAW